MMKTKRPYPLIILSLVFLFNPNINLIDVMPDFIAYALLVLVIGKLSETVPYISECKDSLVKLTLVTLIKIPAFMVMYANMKYGSDIVSLFTLSFAVLELIFIYSAVKNLFLALSYIGERTDCASVRGNFPMSKKTSLSPDTLEKITLVFFSVKGALNVMPELMMLTREDFALKKELSDAYPTVLVLSVTASLIIGIIWLKYAVKSVKYIYKKGDLPAAIRTIDSYVHPESSPTKKLLKKLTDALNLLALSSIFLFDISFQDFGGYNILPHFIYGLVLFSSVISLTDSKKLKLSISVLTVVFSLIAIVNQALVSRFFGLYEYADLAYSNDAKADYTIIKIGSAVETVFIIAVMVFAAIILVRFIKEHTEISPGDPSYRESNKREHSRLIKNTLPLIIVAGIINILKCINVFLKDNISIIESDANPEGIIASGNPAFSTAIFLICIVYVIYSYVTVSNLKEAVKFKYNTDQ